jgi:O-antigen/teichoic acid export membrane protein
VEIGSPAASTSSAEATTSSASDRPSLAARAVGSSVWSLTNQIFQVVMGLGSFAILSRWLTPHDYGLFGMAATVSAFVGVIGDAGVSSAIIRLPQIDAVAEATAFWLSLAGAGILTLLCGVAAPLIGWFYREPSITPLALGMAATFILAAPGRVSTAKLTRQLDFRASTAISIGSAVGTIVPTVALAAHGFGAWALVFQMGSSMALQSILSVFVAPPRLKPSLVSRARGRELAGFGSRLSGFSLATTIGRSLDNVLAGRFLGSAAVGFMAMGVKLVFFPVERLCGAIYLVFLPATVELTDVDRQANAFKAALRLLMIIVAPFCLGTFAIAPEVVALLPAKWAGLAPLLRVYALVTLVLPFNYLSLSVLIAHGRASILFRTAVALIPVCWLGAALGALSGSVLAMVIAWAFAITVGASVAFFFAWQQVKLTSDLWKKLAAPLATSVAMAIVVRFVVHVVGKDGTRVGFVVGAAAGAALYVALAWLTMSADVVRTASLLRQSVARRRSGQTG